MADTKISALPVATTPLSGAEIVPLVQSGVTRQTTVDAISAAAGSSSTVVGITDIGTAPNEVPLNQYLGTMAFQDADAVSVGYIRSNATTGSGYALGAGSTVTQATSRTTGVTINAACGAITLVSAAGTTTPASFTVTNSSVAATDVIILNQKSGTDKQVLLVTAVAAGSFQITAYTTGGTTTEQPVINFAVIKAVTA
jgi:hypothetical protein